MKLALLISILVMVLSGSALSQESCPVQVTDVRNINAGVTVVLKNNSAAITSYEFGIFFSDFEGRTYIFPFPLVRKDNLAAGQSRTASFPTLDSLQFLFPEAGAYLLKVSFADGSSWADDGSRQCSITALQE